MSGCIGGAIGIVLMAMSSAKVEHRGAALVLGMGVTVLGAVLRAT